ncbi:MAG TPA: dockerin type I domain-containing protein, partial [Oscillospiraceae bacterium]|nr:dockerin type I domain-containing protein [Oscillospiraceae bacterium]
ITASSLISNFNGGNIKIYKDGKVLGSDELVGTGCVVKLIGDGGEVIDSLTVVIKGDVDGDGVVGVTDARTVLRVAVELENFNTNAPAKLAGDVDGDGSISVTEARTILRVAVGLENSF